MDSLPVQTPVMARTLLLGVAALATLATVVWPVGSAGQGVRAIVVSIGDGDTIRVRQGGRAITVRLACIDAPEAAQSPYGKQARRYLQERLPTGREVSLDVKTSDRYGRMVAEVFSGVNINLALVEDGQAFAYRQYLGGCNAKTYLDAEVRASRRRIGVWQIPAGITRPWDFRRGRRSASIPDATPISMATAMGWPENPCAEWVLVGTGTGTPESHHSLKSGVV